MKYFRTYPWGMQVLLFLLMAFTLISAGSVLIQSLMFPLSGFQATQMVGLNDKSPAALINATIIVEGASNFFVFFLSAFLFAYLAHPRPFGYLGLRKPGKPIQPILAILVMLGAMPILEGLGGLISHIDFGPGVKAAQKANDDLMTALLHMPTLTTFVKVFLIMSVIPAMGEELFFRGILMRFARRKANNMLWPILFTAATFAAIHSNAYGLISIFLAGVLLAVIYYLTGSIWCSILAHMFFNGSQVILSYASNNNTTLRQLGENPNITYYLVAGGALLFGVSFYLLWKNRTPLPDDWANDYNKEDESLTPSLSEGEGEVE